MLETPAMYAQRQGTPITAPAENLARFSWHTGACPQRIESDEVCPILFRDVGFQAMSRFLDGSLQRLCGPLSPITYLRTANYREPYTDYGRTGRIMLLRPLNVRPWHSGQRDIYIASSRTDIDPASMVFIPADVSLQEAARRFGPIHSALDFVHQFGVSCYADAIAETSTRLSLLQQTHQQAEIQAAPLRRQYQSMDQREREQSRHIMQRLGLTESDLCTAWPHIPDERRSYIMDAMREAEALRC